MAKSRQSWKDVPRHAYALLCGAAGLSLAAAGLCLIGCMPEQQAGFSPVRPAATAAGDAKMAENAVWREKYQANRPVPPREFSVPPKPPRNNAYGEFDETNFLGLDAQAALPRLPDDPSVMPMLGGPATYPMAASSYPTAVNLRQGNGGSGLSGGGNAGFSGAGSGKAGPAGAGTSTGNHAASGYSQGGGGDYLADQAAAGRAVQAAENPRGQGIQTEGHFYPIEQLVYGGDYPDIDKPELYRLMPKDVITVSVKEHPEFSGKLEIQPDGTVQIPNCTDLVRLRGLTVDEAAEALRQELQLFVKGDCVVRVQANRARGGYYFVFGDVRQPGRFPMGLEPIRLSEAVLASNWEANPTRSGYDDEEFGPAFPTASPRGKYIAPGSSDLARVMLITPHRSRPAREVHDVRSAMMGVTRNDPLVKPGQVIVVPSLDPQKNLALGLDLPETAVPPPARNQGGGYPGGGGSGGSGSGSGSGGGGGFSDSYGKGNGSGFSGRDTPARLPEVLPTASPLRNSPTFETPCIETNLARNYGVQSTTPATPVEEPEIYYEPPPTFCPDAAPCGDPEVCVPNAPKLPGSWGRTTLKVEVPPAEAYPASAGYLPGTISSVPIEPRTLAVPTTPAPAVKAAPVPAPVSVGGGAVTVPSVNPKLPPAAAVPASPPASLVVQTQQVYAGNPGYADRVVGGEPADCEAVPSPRGRRLQRRKMPGVDAGDYAEPVRDEVGGWRKGF